MENTYIQNLTVAHSFICSLMCLQNEVSQKIETKLFLSHIWEDPRLKWNPANYSGVEILHIPASDLWFPVFVLYNK